MDDLDAGTARILVFDWLDKSYVVKRRASMSSRKTSFAVSLSSNIRKQLLLVASGAGPLCRDQITEELPDDGNTVRCLSSRASLRRAEQAHHRHHRCAA